MWFDNLAQILEIAARGGTSVFVVPNEARVEVPMAIMLEPEEKTVITIEQVRKMTAGLGLKQITDKFVVIRPADKLGLDAANALLKNLEEPGDKVHYILLTEAPSKLLPTILSRAAVYFWRDPKGLSMEIVANEKDKEIAKKLIVAKPADLIGIADKMAKKKQPRAEALRILGLAVEMLQKSYLITGKEVFVQKLPKYLKAYENISQNGHVKLHMVADLC